MKVPLDCAEAVAQQRHWINTIATVAWCLSKSSWLLLKGGGHGGGGLGCVGPSGIWGRSLHSPFPHHQTHCPFPPPQPFYEIRQHGRWKTAGPFLWVFNQKWYSTVLTGYCEVQVARIVKMSTETLQAVYLKTVGLLDFGIYFCSALHKWKKKFFFKFFKKDFFCKEGLYLEASS